MTAPKLSKPTENGRFYTHPKTHHDVPSVTNVKDTNDKSKFLNPWTGRKCGEAVADSFPVIQAMFEAGDRDGIVDYVRTAPNRNSDGASAIGDLVHGWIDDFIREGGRDGDYTPSLDPDSYEGNRRLQAILRDKAKTTTARHMFIQFLGWDRAMFESVKLEWLHSEVTVWSVKHDYAGTLDWMARFTPRTGKPYVVLGDTKTGNSVYSEVGLQLAALTYADFAIDADGNEFQLPKPESWGVLHVRPRFARLQPVEHIEESFQAFLGLRAAFDWHCNTKDNVLKLGRKVESSVVGK